MYELGRGVLSARIAMLGALAALAASAGSQAIRPSWSVPFGVPTPEAGAAAGPHAIPALFVPNRGQFGSSIRYEGRGPGYVFAFGRDRVTLHLKRRHGSARVVLRFVGAAPGFEVEGEGRQPGTVSYFIGADPGRWRTRLPTYTTVVYREVWPGIDVAFRARSGRLKYEFRLRPGARPDDIRLAYSGASGVSLDRRGRLRVAVAGEVLTDERPTSYELIGSRRRPVPSRFALRGRLYGFALGAHDARNPLVIDPGLVYSTYLGGASGDVGLGIAVDAAGSSYVTGRTASADFPATVGFSDASSGGGDDAFVAKLTGDGSGLVYAAFLGGSSLDEGRGVAVDAAGNVYLSGFTTSADFPTSSAIDASYNGAGDAYVAKIDPSGSRLIYSTYLGGGDDDRAFALAVASDGAAYVAGETASSDFLVTPGAFDTTANGDFDSFVTRIDPSGALGYSTYIGGPGPDDALAITLGANGNACVTGKTSGGYPTTPGSYDSTQNGGYDAFVSKLARDGSSLVYSTYLGGDSWDEGLGIGVDGTGNIYLAGNVQSRNFPTTAGAWDRSLDGAVDGFVTKLNPSGSALVYSTFLGGTSWDEPDGLAVDGSGNVYVAGHLGSDDFPTTTGAFDETSNGSVNGFLTKLGSTGADLAYSTYLGGSGWDGAFALAIDGAGAAYLTGPTESPDFPTTPGSFDVTANGETDVFVAKIDPTLPPPPPPPLPDFALAATPDAQQVVQGGLASYTVTIAPTNGFVASVDLGVSGLPNGTTATFVPNPARTSSTLVLLIGASSPIGSYLLTISGTGGGVMRATAVTLDVQAPTAPDFALSATPLSRSVVRGSNATYTVAVRPIGGFQGAVDFTVSGIPAGAWASFTPNPTGSSWTLAVTTSRATGTYTLTIVGTSGSLRRTTTVDLTVTTK